MIPGIFVFIIIVSTCILPARATLRITGDSPHASTWQRLYDQFSDVFKSKNVLVVREVSDDEMDELVGEHERDLQHTGNSDQGVVDAFFQSAQSERDPTPSITIRRMLPEGAAAFIFTHEYGHFVWYSKLNREQRSGYTRLWKQQRRAGKLVTKYASEDEYEGFAEAFAFYVRNPGKLKRLDLESWKFLDGFERGAKGNLKGSL